MNLRALEYLLALAETGHFGRAATQCHVTQPTLSTQLAKLERELGVSLFERGSRQVTPTPAGQAVVTQARIVMDEVRQLQELARSAGEPLSGPFRLGGFPTIGPYLVPHILPTLRRLFPKMQLFLQESMSANLVESLHNSDLDAAILSPPFNEPSLELEVIGEEEFVLAVPPNHRLVGQGSVTFADLQGENMLLLEEGHCMRDQTADICRARRQTSGIPFQASSLESLRQMVSAGIGCTLLPTLATSGPFAIATPVSVLPFVEPASRQLVMAWRRSYPHGAALRRLAQELATELAPSLRFRKQSP